VFEVRPLEDPRWRAFVHGHPKSSVFHTPEWLGALRQTYGYQPVAFTTAPQWDALRNAAVFCYVDSWLTGRRLVSIPFADHANLLVDHTTDRDALFGALQPRLREDRLRYVELRQTEPLETAAWGPHSGCTHCLHQLDLEGDLDSLLDHCHKDSTKRKIRRAEREGLTCEEGTSAALLDCFYRLLVMTRRRHWIPPQPKKWFQSLIEHFGKALKIRVAFCKHRPVAAILTLHFKDTVVYKYGCSDAQFHRLGGMQWLLWQAIREAKAGGARIFDLGRSEWQNTGLIRFKDRWGASRATITYLRLLPSAHSAWAYQPAAGVWQKRIAQQVFPYLPDRMLVCAGNLLYRHVG
jgi:hypothetical protein